MERRPTLSAVRKRFLVELLPDLDRWKTDVKEPEFHAVRKLHTRDRSVGAGRSQFLIAYPSLWDIREAILTQVSNYPVASPKS